MRCAWSSARLRRVKASRKRTARAVSTTAARTPTQMGSPASECSTASDHWPSAAAEGTCAQTTSATRPSDALDAAAATNCAGREQPGRDSGRQTSRERRRGEAEHGRQRERQQHPGGHRQRRSASASARSSDRVVCVLDGERAEEAATAPPHGRRRASSSSCMRCATMPASSSTAVYACARPTGARVTAPLACNRVKIVWTVV